MSYYIPLGDDSAVSTKIWISINRRVLRYLSLSLQLQKYRRDHWLGNFWHGVRYCGHSILSLPSNSGWQFFFFFFFWPYQMACGILVPQPGTEPAPPVLEVRSLNPCTAREVPGWQFLLSFLYWWENRAERNCESSPVFHGKHVIICLFIANVPVLFPASRC